MSIVTVLVVGSSKPQEAVTGVKSISFDEIKIAKTANEKSKLLNSKKVTINGKEQLIDFTTLMVTGHKDNGEIFGLIKDENDKAIKFEDGSSYVCNGTNGVQGSGLDFSSILQKNGTLYMVNQFECNIGAMYMFELLQDEKTGVLTPKKNTLKFISQKSEFGGFVHCSGQVTPWSSHLGSEEYEPDARYIEENADEKGMTQNVYYDEMVKFFSGDRAKLNPYFYGWIPEVKINADGTPNYTKHYSMGRFSHELAYVMPDSKTVYMSDDGTNVGLFMFVASRAKDLSAGTLYAAKVLQNSAKDGGDFSLSWINLGYTTDEKVRTAVASMPKFSTFFEIAKVDENSNCPIGFKSINTSAYHECLKLKDGVDEVVVSRVETRRYAAYMGATTEFRKEEGITFNPLTNKLYVAMSAIEKGMENNQKASKVNSKYDIGGNNDIRVDYNYCGGVYELNVHRDKTIKSDYVANSMRAILTGTMIETDAHGNRCDLNGISNPDNITMLLGTDILSIAEDTSHHENNIIWAYNLKSGNLSRIISTPIGAESTSPFWYTNINGWAYMTAVTQHPNRDTKNRGESSVGVLGPIKFKQNTSVDLTSKKIVNNKAAYITSQCYTKTKDSNGQLHNPCMNCHINSKRPNYVNDWSLQEELAFNEYSKINRFTNLFKDRTSEVDAISDDNILTYIRKDNYKNSQNQIILAEQLKNLPKRWDFNSNEKWDGYMPDCYFNFDDEGFDINPKGGFTGWRAFGYYPFLGTFWPTNGSTDDVLIRLDNEFQTIDGKFDKDTYKVNLAIVEAMIKETNITIESVDESKWGVDLDKNGLENRTTQVTYQWMPLQSIYMSYVGDAKKLYDDGKVHIAAGLYPENTEFLHTVRYMDIDKTTQNISMSARVKELRYAKKYGWNTYAQIQNGMMAEVKEKEDFPERLKTVLGNMEEGLNNGYGWIYQGFIEDKEGYLRPQTYEETLYCIGCHSTIGAIVDSTFVFPRKFNHKQAQMGWSHWTQLKDGFKNIKEPILADGRHEYALYLQNNHSGDEFRANNEVIEKFFENNGSIKIDEVKKLQNNIDHLIIPSIKRAIKLNKAYKVIVNEQSFIYGRDAHITPTKNVHKEVKIDQKTGLKAIGMDRYPLRD